MPTIDRYVSPLKLPMSIDAFWRLPHLPAYRAEYANGHVELTYRPRLSMARLPVAARAARAVPGTMIRPLDGAHAHEALAKLFVNAFARVPPLDLMVATTRRHAADSAMRHTLTGGDGEVFRSACFGAFDADDDELIGAAIVTRVGLRPDEWPEAELPSALLNLTWLFVSPDHQRRQVGSALLDRVVNVLAEQRVPWLVSHILEDNVPSVMFHWRHRFELVPAIVRE
jgi:ribosomal protein S18 acetylase RimI-like enzyme